MKKVLIIAVAALALLAAGCSSLPGMAGTLVNTANSAQTVVQSAEAQDFRSSEVLCSDGDGSNFEEMGYRVATVLTPASPATKNQAEVVFVSDGKKAWSSFVIPTHKAAKSELIVGKLVFVPWGWSEYAAKDVPTKEYRQTSWAIGRITSTDELFKNFVEVDGSKYDPALVRVANVPLE